MVARSKKSKLVNVLAGLLLFESAGIFTNLLVEDIMLKNNYSGIEKLSIEERKEKLRRYEIGYEILIPFYSVLANRYE